MRSDKVYYFTEAGVYCTTHEFKMLFCVPDFYIRKIINHQFHVNNDKGESGIGYDIIIGHELIMQLGLTADFKRQILQWEGATVPMKEPSYLLG